MRLSLKPHPDFPYAAGITVETYVSRGKTGNLLLHYYLTETAKIRIPRPPSGRWSRANGLWKHTCFEAFIRGPDSAAYYEFNFSPSTAWAIYHFDQPREGVRSAEEIGDPSIEPRYTNDTFEVRVHLKLNGTSELPADEAWHLNLTAVIEEEGGRKSYWALAHPAGKPDFHNPDCFVLELPAA